MVVSSTTGDKSSLVAATTSRARRFPSRARARLTAGVGSRELSSVDVSCPTEVGTYLVLTAPPYS